MSKQSPEELFAAVRQELVARGVPEEYWVLGHFEEDRYCLVFEEGTWKLGGMDRQYLDIELETSDADEARRVFVRWVEDGRESAIRRSESYRRWREEHGIDP